MVKFGPLVLYLFGPLVRFSVLQVSISLVLQIRSNVPVCSTIVMCGQHRYLTNWAKSNPEDITKTRGSKKEDVESEHVEVAGTAEDEADEGSEGSNKVMGHII